MKKIILVADDFALSKGVNRAILELWKKGIIKHTAILTEGQAFHDAVKIAKENPGLELSLHLTVTFHKPVLNRINSLTDDRGFFMRSNAVNKNFAPIEKELFEEFDAQMQKAIKHGLKIKAINCHHNIQMNKGVWKSFLKISKKYNIPIRNPEGLIPKKEINNILSIFGNTTFFQDNATIDELNRIFTSMKENQIIDIQCHPGYFSDELKNVTSYNQQREKELKLFKSIKFKKLIKKHQIFLTTFEELVLNEKKS